MPAVLVPIQFERLGPKFTVNEECSDMFRKMCRECGLIVDGYDKSGSNIIFMFVKVLPGFVLTTSPSNIGSEIARYLNALKTLDSFDPEAVYKTRKLNEPSFFK